MKKYIIRIILKLTHRFWGPVIDRELGRFYERGIINSRQLHELAAKFDRTSKTHLLTK